MRSLSRGCVHAEPGESASAGLALAPRCSGCASRAAALSEVAVLSRGCTSSLAGLELPGVSRAFAAPSEGAVLALGDDAASLRPVAKHRCFQTSQCVALGYSERQGRAQPKCFQSHFLVLLRCRPRPLFDY